MKINPDKQVGYVDNQVNKPEAQKKDVDRKAAGTEMEGASKVTVSSKGEQAAAIRAKADEAPEVRREKVNEMKARLEADTYEPSSKSVADKMIANSLIESLYSS